MPAKQTYIKNIHLLGYKSIKDVSCDFDKGLNIIIGNNGSGKSNILNFVYNILRRDYSGLDKFEADIDIFDANINFSGPGIEGNKETNDSLFNWHVEGTLPLKRLENRDIISLVPQINEPLDNKSFYVEFVKYDLPDKIGILSEEYNPRYNFKEKRFLADPNSENVPLALAVWIRIAYGSYLENKKDTVELTDENLYLSLNELFDKHFDDVRKKMSMYTPVGDFRFSKSVRIANIDSSTYEFRNIVFEYKVNNEWFSWNALSDGTRRLVYMILMIEGVEVVFNAKLGNYKLFPITLIEEPELGIHPHQLHSLLQFLREKSKDQQIIITTHSPQVLDILEPNELNKIIIAEIDFENGTILRHLTNEEILKARSYFKDQGLLSDYWRFSDFQRSKITK